MAKYVRKPVLFDAMITQNDLIGARVRTVRPSVVYGQVHHFDLEFGVNKTVTGKVWVAIAGAGQNSLCVAFKLEDIEFLDLNWDEPRQLERP